MNGLSIYIYSLCEVLMMLLRAIRSVFWCVTSFGAWMMMVTLVAADKEPRSGNSNTTSASNNCSSNLRAWLSRLLLSLQTSLKDLCRVQSVWVPLLSTTTVYYYIFRSMESHQISLPGTDDYQTICPSDSRRTATGAAVKLFAATVTTIGVRGHLHSLIDIRSWSFELFRASEVIFHPLASLFSLSEVLWYGFADLLQVRPGPWSSSVPFRYRLARVFGGYVETDSGDDTRYLLGLVNPQHIEATPLGRNLKWAGRVMILFVLLGQYTQAGVLLSRRILSSTAAGVDYAMAFLVLNGLVTLAQSLMSLLLNVSWKLRSNFQPCTEKLCSLPECTTLKQEQGLPSYRLNIRAFGIDISFYPRAMLYELAGDWLQLIILGKSYSNTWQILLTTCALRYVWKASITYILLLDTLRTLPGNQDENQAPGQPQASTAQPSEDQPVPETDNTPSSKFDYFLFVLMFLAGMVYIAIFVFITAFQMMVLLGPSIFLYWRIASELSSWSSIDSMQPCPQLWKDALEDELWWF